MAMRRRQAAGEVAMVARNIGARKRPHPKKRRLPDEWRGL